MTRMRRLFRKQIKEPAGERIFVFFVSYFVLFCFALLVLFNIIVAISFLEYFIQKHA